jgi:hypothetical protein
MEASITAYFEPLVAMQFVVVKVGFVATFGMEFNFMHFQCLFVQLVEMLVLVVNSLVTKCFRFVT